MEVSDLILADYAVANEGGKFTLVGAGFTKIGAKVLPCVHPLMFLLVRLKVTRDDKGKNKINIQFVGESGSVFKAEGYVDVFEDHDEEQQIPLPIRIDNLKFDQAGQYNIEVRVNGEQKASQQLTVVFIEEDMKY